MIEKINTFKTQAPQNIPNKHLLAPLDISPNIFIACDVWFAKGILVMRYAVDCLKCW